MDTVDGAVSQPVHQITHGGHGHYESMLYNNALLQQLSSPPSLSSLPSLGMSNGMGGIPPPPPPLPQVQVQLPTTAAQMATVQCVHCSTQLSYPTGSAFIQCPKCSNTMNPQQPNMNYMNCVGCNTLLSHPPSSVQIQCPKCYVIMELPVRGVVPPAAAAAPGGAANNASAAAAAAAAAAALKKTRKKRKDPSAPKRASNAYMIFCKERRARLKEERPDLPFGKLGATLGELWRTLSQEEKKPYELRASGDRDRYKKEMSSYNSSGGAKGGEKEKKKKAPAAGGAEKKVKTTHGTGQAIASGTLPTLPDAGGITTTPGVPPAPPSGGVPPPPPPSEEEEFDELGEEGDDVDQLGEP